VIKRVTDLICNRKLSASYQLHLIYITEQPNNRNECSDDLKQLHVYNALK